MYVYNMSHQSQLTIGDPNTVSILRIACYRMMLWSEAVYVSGYLKRSVLQPAAYDRRSIDWSCRDERNTPSLEQDRVRVGRIPLKSAYDAHQRARDLQELNPGVSQLSHNSSLTRPKFGDGLGKLGPVRSSPMHENRPGSRLHITARRFSFSWPGNMVCRVRMMIQRGVGYLMYVMLS